MLGDGGGRFHDLGARAHGLDRRLGRDAHGILNRLRSRRLLLVGALGPLVGGDDEIIGGGVLVDQREQLVAIGEQKRARRVERLTGLIGAGLCLRQTGDHGQERGAEGADHRGSRAAARRWF